MQGAAIDVVSHSEQEFHVLFGCEEAVAFWATDKNGFEKVEKMKKMEKKMKKWKKWKKMG